MIEGLSSIKTKRKEERPKVNLSTPSTWAVSNMFGKNTYRCIKHPEITLTTIEGINLQQCLGNSLSLFEYQSIILPLYLNRLSATVIFRHLLIAQDRFLNFYTETPSRFHFVLFSVNLLMVQA